MLLPWSAQIELIHALLVSKETCRELAGVLETSHFDNRHLGFLATAALNLFTTYGEPATEGQLHEVIHAQNPTSHGPLLELLAEVGVSQVPATDWAIRAGREGAAGMELIRLGAAMRPAVEAGRFDDIGTAVREALAIAAPSGELTVGCGTVEEVIARHTGGKPRVGTGIYRLDKFLNGGLEQGRLGFVLAKKGGGKSHTLISLAGAALLSGLRVFYCSLEMPSSEVRARMDRRLLQLHGDEFIEQLPVNMPFLSEHHDRLTVLDATKRRVSLHSLVAALGRCETAPDLVLVDYLALLRGNRGGGGQDAQRARMQELGEFAQDLRIEVAAAMSIPVWSALQLNRTGIKKVQNRSDDGGSATADITDAALSIEPLWHCDVAMTVNQSITEAESQTGRIFLAENRDGVSLRTIECKLAWEISHIHDLFEQEPQAEETPKQEAEK